MTEIRRALADLDRPPALAHQRFAAHRHELDGLGVAERFIRIHEINLWGSEKSVSGLGSEPAATAIVRAKLAGLLRRLGAKSLLDAPCGDAGWMRGVDLEGIAYSGIDIVPSLIAQLQDRNEPAGSYACADIIIDRLPRCDVVLCRDCLVHLSFDHAAMAVAKVWQASLESPDPTRVAATGVWLTGAWLLMATAEDLDRLACSSDRPVIYDGDGTLRFADGRGRWSLRGRILVETITLAYESAGSDLHSEIGRPARIAIRRVGPDEGAMLADGVWLPMLRCRPGDRT